MGGGFGNLQTMGQFGIGSNPVLDGQAPGLPRGHGRRHSVNVVNKPGAPQGGSISYGANPYAAPDGYEDGFAPPPYGHSRQVSRADSSWRIS